MVSCERLSLMFDCSDYNPPHLASQHVLVHDLKCMTMKVYWKAAQGLCDRSLLTGALFVLTDNNVSDGWRRRCTFFCFCLWASCFYRLTSYRLTAIDWRYPCTFSVFAFGLLVLLSTDSN
jgi:hypothetical protein